MIRHSVILSLLLSITSFNTTTYAQGTAPGIVWQKTIGCSGIELAYDFFVDNQGNFLIAGQSGDSCEVTGSILGYMDGWVIKLDTNGNKIWSTVLGGDSVDAFYKIIQMSDNGYAVVGISQSDFPADTNKGGNDCWIVKLDVNGIVQWQKTFGGPGFDNAYDVVETSNGGLLIVGSAGALGGDVTSYQGGPADAWAIMLDHLGNLVWQKTYGSTLSDLAHAVVKTPDGNFLITGQAGTANGDIATTHGSYGDVWVFKINTLGNILWSKTYGGSAFEYGTCLLPVQDSGYLVGAMTKSNDMDVSFNYGGYDMWTFKINNAGAMQWQKSYGGSNDDYLTSIIKDSYGGYLLSGASLSYDHDAVGNHGVYSDVLAVKIDDTGGRVWTHMYGGSSGETVAGLHQFSDSSYLIGANTNSNDGDVAENNGATNAWLIRLAKSDLAASVLSNGEKDIKVFPTVTDDVINIQLPGNSEQAKCSLYDLTGRVVNFQQEWQGNTYNLRLKGLTSGMYLLRVQYGNKLTTRKVVYTGN